MASTAFAAEVLADGPIGYWRLGEPAGSVSAADASGNRNEGAASGGVTFGQPGFHGGDTAALFDGSTGRVTVLNSNSLNPPHITIEARSGGTGRTTSTSGSSRSRASPSLRNTVRGSRPTGTSESSSGRARHR
jgi:hypothetical protein